jgi:hypothetical protein
MRLGSLVCGLLLISIIYLMDFLYLQQGLESRPCREILHIYNSCAVLCFFFVSRPSMEKSPPYCSLHATDNSTFTFTLHYSIF